MQERGPVPALAPPRRAPLVRGAGAGLVAAVVVAFDQVTKSLALDRLADGPVDVFWTLRFNLSFNSGAAFGMGRGIGPIVLGLGIVMVVALLGLWRMATERWSAAVALGLLFGGALGNLGDRLFRDHGGAVVDFIDFQWWPIFNIADVGISCGAVLMILASRAGPDDERPADA